METLENTAIYCYKKRGIKLYTPSYALGLGRAHIYGSSLYRVFENESGDEIIKEIVDHKTIDSYFCKN